MSLVTQLQNLATRIATENKALRTLINGNAADLSALTTTATDSLVNAINELDALIGGASATTLDDLTDVVIVTPANGHLIRYNNGSGKWENVLGTTYFDAAGAAATAAAASQPLDSDLTSIAALTTTSYGRAFLELANQAALVALLPGYQPLDTDLTALAALVSAADKVAYATGAGTWALTDFTSAGRALVDDANASAQRTTLGLVIGTDVQAYDGDLASIAALTTTSYGRALLTLADAVALTAAVNAATATVSGIVELATTTEATTGTDTVRAVTPAGLKAAIDALIASAPGALDTLNELAAALGNDANFAATMTTALAGKQPLDTDLTAIAALTSAANKGLQSTGAGTWALYDLTAAGKALLDDADATAQRATLSVYSTTEIGDPTTNFVTTFETGLV